MPAFLFTLEKLELGKLSEKLFFTNFPKALHTCFNSFVNRGLKRLEVIYNICLEFLPSAVCWGFHLGPQSIFSLYPVAQPAFCFVFSLSM